jgi:DNA-binding NarL/FixJ family response regulator
VSEDVYQKAKELRRQGLSFRKIGRDLDIDEGTIRKRIRALESTIKYRNTKIKDSLKA